LELGPGVSVTKNGGTPMKISTLLLTFVFSAGALAIEMPSTSGSLVEEVLSTSNSPHKWDWRQDLLTVEFGYSSIMEHNSFESRSYNVGVFKPLRGPWLARGSARFVRTEGTASSEMLALTPFSQAAQPSRHEFVAGAGYTLMDGRSATPLSPRLTDIGHALYGLLGLQYNHYSKKDPEPIEGMRAVYYDLALETGVRLQIYFPENLGLGLEWTYSRPLSGGDPDLRSWQRFTGSVSWSFGR